MGVSASSTTVTDLIDSLTGATPDRRDYRRLIGALWEGGELTDRTVPAIPDLIACLDRVDVDLAGHLAVLLGLIAEAEYPATDGEAATAVRRGVGVYLEMLRRLPPEQPLSLALRYLLSHFPGDRDRILAVAAELDLPPDDLSRLERALRRLDPDRPDLGRVFPSPAVWTLDDSEREFDRSWIRGLSPQQIVESWRNDTRTVFGSAGAKAYWAVRNGVPARTSIPELPRDGRIPRPADPDEDFFGPHAAAFRCPSCGGGLVFAPRAAECARCAATYPITRGILDLSPSTGSGDLQLKLAEMPSMGAFYETYARPHFLRVSGSNWADQVTPADEDAYIAEHVHPVEGPVLDLAAGAGRWTEVLARAVGAERVIALDPSAPMVATLRTRLPKVPAVMASAADLPFADASLGAVLCWNALQAFPAHAAAAIREVGRCLRPGGTFTLLTFRMSDDPVYRYFQGQHRLPQHMNGLRLFEPDQLHRWLADAGLRVREESGPGTFVFITAERP